MKPHIAAAFAQELEKTALIERLVRLAATDVEDLPGVNKVIKSTPRLFMRKRSPEELGELQHGVQRFFDSYEQPAIGKAHSLIERLPQATPARERVKGLLSRGAEAVIKNPELAVTELSPMPGTGLAWLGAKKGLERAIDRFAPAQSLKT
jgi:hypothetical protein